MGVIINGNKFSSKNNYKINQSVTLNVPYANETTYASGSVPPTLDYIQLSSSINKEFIFNFYVDKIKLYKDDTFLDQENEDITDVNLFKLENLKITLSTSSSYEEYTISELKSILGIDLSYSLSLNGNILSVKFSRVSGGILYFSGFSAIIKYNNKYVTWDASSVTNLSSIYELLGYCENTSVTDVYNSKLSSAIKIQTFDSQDETYTFTKYLSSGDILGDFSKKTRNDCVFYYKFYVSAYDDINDYTMETKHILIKKTTEQGEISYV